VISRRIVGSLPFAVFLLLVATSWNRWLEPYVDSGRELMAPWRIARGESLYRDVRFFHGPLGPYLAAGVEGLVERSLPARFALGALVALLHVEALRRLARRFLSPGRAALAVASVVAIAFFLRPGGCHVFPFSLDTSLATAAIAWAIVLAGAGSQRAAWAAGGALAVALLSRPELGLAALAALLIDRARPAGPRRRRLLPLGVAPVAAAAAGYLAVSRGTPLETLRGEGWLAILRPPSEFRTIYAAYAGFDAPALRIAELLLAAAVLTLVAGLLWIGARAAQRSATPSTARSVEAGALLLLAAAAVLAWRPPAALAETVRLFPPVIRVVPPLVLAAAASRFVRRVWGRPERGPFAGVPDAVLLLGALFSLRMLLVAGYFGPYNAFLLPLPLLGAFAGLFAAADSLASRAPRLPRLVAGAVAVLLLSRVAALRDVFRHPGWSPVATPAGSLFLPQPVAGATRAALADLDRRVPPGGSLTGFPEVGFLNYALGRPNPLAQDQFFPGHLDAAAERAVIARLGAAPPHAIVYANVLAVGHRAEVFGRDYLRALDAHVRGRFTPAASFGPGSGPDPAVGDPDFFLQVRVP